MELFLLLFLLLYLSWTRQGEAAPRAVNSHRRCIILTSNENNKNITSNDETATTSTTNLPPLARLFETPCFACPPTSRTVQTKKEEHRDSNATRIAILLSPWHRSYASMGILASQLLRRGHTVEMLSIHHCRLDSSRDRLTQQIYSHLSCDSLAEADTRLQWRELDHDDTNQVIKDVSVPCGDDNNGWTDKSPYDTLDVVEIEYQLVKRVLETDPELPHVIVLDANHVGALMVAEQLGIPAVTLASRSYLQLLEIYDWMLGMLRFVEDRLGNLQYTAAFLRLNQKRRAVRLPLLRTLADVVLEKSVAVLVQTFPELEGWSAGDAAQLFSPQVHLLGPLVPECMECDNVVAAATEVEGDKNATIEKKRSTINVLVLPMKGLGRADVRTLLRGLSLARVALQSFVQTMLCDFVADTDGAQEVEDCVYYTKLAHFEVVWLLGEDSNATMSALPTLLPDFVSVSNETALSSMAQQHSETALLVSYCEMEPSLSLLATGVPFLCLPRKSKQNHQMSHRLAHLSNGQSVELQSQELADTVLGILVANREGQEPEKESEIPWDGAERAATIVGIVASIRQQHSAKGESLNRDELRSMRMGIFRVLPTYTTTTDWSTYIWKHTTMDAWIILSLTVIYFSIRGTAMAPTVKRWFRNNVLGGEGIMQTLDIAAYHFSEWLSDDASLHNRIGPGVRPVPEIPEKEQSSKELAVPKKNASNTGHHTRRRRAVKRR